MIKYKQLVNKIKKVLDKDYIPIEASIHKEKYIPIEAGIKKERPINENLILEDKKINHGALVKHYSDPGYSKKEESLDHYVHNGYLRINSHLHQTKGKPTQHLEHIHNLDSILKKKKTPSSLVVHSGIDGTKYHNILVNHKGKGPIKVVHHGYLSTSLNPDIAHQFADDKSYNITHYDIPLQKTTSRYESNIHVLKIHVPKGHPGTYIPASITGNLDKHSKKASNYEKEFKEAHAFEKEFLLPRGTKLHIHPKPEIKVKRGSYGSKTNHYTWHAKVVK